MMARAWSKERWGNAGRSRAAGGPCAGKGSGGGLRVGVRFANELELS